MKRTIAASLFALVLGFSTSVEAGLVSVLASDNATVQNAGPRTGTSGKRFFNMEGSSNAAFASFGVADFNFGSLLFSGPVSSITAANLALTQSNAAFSKPSGVSVYFTADTGDSIQPVFSPFVDQNAFAPPPVDGLASVDPALGPFTLLGSGNYVKNATGSVDNYALNFADGALTSFINALNGGSKLRLVVTADDAAGAATYAGYTNTLAGPTLSFTTDAALTVPEPASLTLLGLGVIGLIGVSRYQRRALGHRAGS